MPERMTIHEGASVAARQGTGDRIPCWRARVRVEHWFREEDRRAGRPPDEVVEREGNMALNAGITRLLNLLVGAVGTAYNNANARLGVGNGTTAAAAGNTDLAAAAGAANRWFQLMDGTYPQVSAQTATFRATFGPSDGNFVWNEWGIDNGSASGATVTAPMLNRKVEASALITKSGGSATLTATITIS